MNEVTEEVTLEQANAEDAETVDTAKTVIRPKTEGYIKGAAGLHKDDLIGHSLSGLTLDQVKSIAGELEIDVTKYDHLNAGQQRMNIGNRLRKVVVGNDINTEHLTAQAEVFKAINADVKAETDAAKAAAKAEKAAAKAEKDAAKAAAKAEKVQEAA
jgi:hypothetical protein